MHALGERIAETAAHVDAAMHRLLADLRVFDAGQGWYAQGAASTAHWLSWRVGWALATAREHVRVARALGPLARIDDALRTGQLSYSKVRAITRVATPATEAALLTDAHATTASQLERVCRKLRMVQDLDRQAPDDLRNHRTVTRRDLESGLVRIELTLLPEEAAIVWAAIEHQTKRLAAPAEAPSVSAADYIRRFDRVDGVVSLCQAALRGSAPNRSPVEVVLTVPKSALATDPSAVGRFQDGSYVSAETSRRLACDAGVVEMVTTDGDQPLSVGRKTRTIPAAIKRALLHRDQTCRFPGCSNRLYLDGHHVRHWADGGETKLDNLCTLCTRHHAFVHEHGYRIETTSAGLVFLDERGRPVPPEGPRPATAHLGVQAIRAANAAAGIDITAATNACGWDGEPVQYERVVDSLWSMERRARGGKR